MNETSRKHSVIVWAAIQIQQQISTITIESQMIRLVQVHRQPARVGGDLDNAMTHTRPRTMIHDAAIHARKFKRRRQHVRRLRQRSGQRQRDIAKGTVHLGSSAFAQATDRRRRRWWRHGRLQNPVLVHLSFTREINERPTHVHNGHGRDDVMALPFDAHMSDARKRGRNEWQPIVGRIGDHRIDEQLSDGTNSGRMQ